MTRAQGGGRHALVPAYEFGANKPRLDRGLVHISCFLRNGLCRHFGNRPGRLSDLLAELNKDAGEATHG